MDVRKMLKLVESINNNLEKLKTNTKFCLTLVIDNWTKEFFSCENEYVRYLNVIDKKTASEIDYLQFDIENCPSTMYFSVDGLIRKAEINFCTFQGVK